MLLFVSEHVQFSDYGLNTKTFERVRKYDRQYRHVRVVRRAILYRSHPFLQKRTDLGEELIS